MKFETRREYVSEDENKIVEMIRLSHDLCLDQDQIHMANTNLGRFTPDSQAFWWVELFVRG